MMQDRRPRNRLRESLVMGGDTLDLETLSSDLLSPTLLGDPAAQTGSELLCIAPCACWNDAATD